MLTNADCTLYRYDKETGGYTEHFISGIFWHENKAGNILKSGLQAADSTTVYLYSDAVVPLCPAKDMLVKGKCDFVFDNTSPQTISESKKRFDTEYRHVTVMSIDHYMFGGLPHIEVSAK